jgi:hypothetical protein
MICYLEFIKLGIKNALNQKIKTDVKLKKFDLLYRQIFKNCALKNNIMYNLQTEFVKENISLSLLSDIVKALKQLSVKTDENDWNNKIYCYQLFVSPLARMIIVLNDLNMSVYMPFTSLLMCAMLISDIMNNKIKQRRFYVSKINGFLKEAKIMPLVIKNKIFRFKAWYVLTMLEQLTKKIIKKRKLSLSNFDFIKILFYASLKWIFVRVKTLNLKGI